MTGYLYRKFIHLFSRLCPAGTLESFIKDCISSCGNNLDPESALKFLFRLDNHIYSLEGRKSVEYGGGLHTKHRHMRYHDFFINRITSKNFVLDIGCGNGALAFDVAENAGATVLGIDKNKDNIEKARTQFPHDRVKYIHGDVLKDLPRERFDVIVLSNVLEHLPDRSQFLKSAITTVMPARCLIRVPLFERDWRVPLKRELGIEWRLDETHEIEYTRESFHKEISQAGLEIMHQEICWGEIWAETTPGSNEYPK